jgi:hypothetical protein
MTTMSLPPIAVSARIIHEVHILRVSNRHAHGDATGRSHFLQLPLNGRSLDYASAAAATVAHEDGFGSRLQDRQVGCLPAATAESSEVLR